MVPRFGIDRFRWSCGGLPPEVRSAIEQLEDVVGRRPELEQPARFYAELVRRLGGQRSQPAPPTWPPDAAAAKLASGIPLLDGEPVAWEALGLQKWWLAVCACLRRQPSGSAAAALGKAVRRRRLDPVAMARELFLFTERPAAAETVPGLPPAAAPARPADVFAAVRELGLDERLAASVLRLSLFAVLSPWSQPASALWASAAWGRGHCPFCGGQPLLAELVGLVRSRQLRCALCAAGWPMDRIFCPVCQNRESRLLASLHVEGEEHRWRIDTCEGCRTYIKTLSRLAPATPAELLIADLATWHLDILAAERGYRPAARPVENH